MRQTISRSAREQGLTPAEYQRMHKVMRKKVTKPGLCKCGVNKPKDMANKGTYDYEVENWEWLCRKCHTHKDGVVSNLLLHIPRKKLPPITCIRYSRVVESRWKDKKFCSRACANITNGKLRRQQYEI